MAAVETYANQPQTTVPAGGTTAPASGTSESWTVASSSSFPAANSGATPPTQFHVADTATGKTGEIIAVTNVSGTTWTVTRGAENTATVAHAAGFTVVQVVSAGALGGLLQAGNNLSDVASASTARTNLGLTGAATASLPLSVANGGTGQASASAALNALGGAAVAGDIGGTSASPQVTGTHLSAALPIAQGGTGQASAAAALSALGGAAVAGDIGGTSASPQVTSTHLASALPIAQGGTGQGTQQAALDALAGAVTSGQVLRGNGTHVQLSALQAGDIPDLAYVDSVSAADSSITVTGAADTPSLSSVPAQYAQRIFAV